MAAIITEQFRRNSAETLESDITSNSYYIGIGQQDAWDDVSGTSASAPYPVGTFKDQQRVLDHLTGLFKINSDNLSRVIPRNDIAVSTKYKAFDPLDPTCFYTDTTNDIKPCYVMAGDQIFLCLQKPVDGSATDAAVINALGNTFDDYGIVTVSGYTFTYLGRYEQYSDINSSSFVDIGNGSATTSARDASTAAFAFVQFTNGTLRLEAQTTGISGNGITVNFQLDETSPYISGIDVAVAGTDVTITVPTNSDSPAGTVDLTIDQLAQAIRDSVNASPLVNTLITAYTVSGGSESADIENLVDSPATFTLGGSNNLDSYIKEKTGGLLYGFNLVNGGNVYEPAGTFTDATTTISADVTVHGTDESGFSRSLTLTNAEYVVNIAAKRIDEIRLTSSHLGDSTLVNNEGVGLLSWKNCRVDISAFEALRGTTILAFADGTATYAEEALRHDAVVMPKIAPQAGFGAAKYETLPSWYLGLFVDTGNATYIPSDTDYHQVSVIKNPQSTGGGNLSGPYFQPLQHFTLPGTQVIPADGANAIGAGWQIVQGGKKVGVISHVQTVESGLPLTSYRYYYYNDHYYGYEQILVSSETDGATAISFEPPKDDTLGSTTVDEASTGLTLIPNANYEGSYSQGTGDVVFIDNRATITREEGQNEELKLIIQL